MRGALRQSTCGTYPFVDLRVAKRFVVDRSSLDATVECFNILNANHVLLQTEQIGSTLGPADPYPDAADHPLRRHRAVLTAARRL